MKIAVAMDSMKGSLTSLEAGMAVKEAIEDVMEDAVVEVIPLNDGEEDSTESYVSGLDASKVPVKVSSPLGYTVFNSYGIIQESNTAVIETATVTGPDKVPESLRNPMNTTSYGVGEMILDALDKGCREFVMVLGDSAVNDGGIGMLRALGVEFYDNDWQKIGKSGKDLLEIVSLNADYLDSRIDECSFKIVSASGDTLFAEAGDPIESGTEGGAAPEIAEAMEQGKRTYARMVAEQTGIDAAETPGAGAAGGLGFACLTFLKASFDTGEDEEAVSSDEADEPDLERQLQDADLIVTGEGRLDSQTLRGKAPITVAKLAKDHGIKVIAFAGGVSDDAYICNREGIDAYFSILQRPVSLEEAMDKAMASRNLKLTVRQVFRLLAMA